MRAIIRWFQILGAGLSITAVSILMRFFRVFETPDVRGIGARPRLHVYGTYNLWRRYCNVSWREARRLRSYELFALIIYHVRVIDDFVDEQLRPQGIPVDARSLKAGSRQLVQLINRKITELSVTDEVKRELVRTFQDYRRRVADAFVVEGHAGHTMQPSKQYSSNGGTSPPRCTSLSSGH